MKKFNWYSLANSVVKAMGGKNNIKNYLHCATRLRIEVKDKKKVNVKAIKNLDVAKGYNFEDPQYQIIFGAGVVNKVYAEFDKIIGNEGFQRTENKKSIPWWNKGLSIKSNIFMTLRRVVRNFGDIFLPLIPVLIAGGIGLAMDSLLNQVGKNNPALKELSKIFGLIGGTIYTLLPAFIGYTMMKKLGGNAFIGMAIGLILVGPSLLGSWTYSSGDYYESEVEKFDKVKDLFNQAKINKDDIMNAYNRPVLLTIFDGFAGGIFKIQFTNYQSQVAPVMLAIGATYWIEKFMKKFTPEAIAIILIPVVTVFITIFLSMWIIGPIGRIVNNWMATGFNGIYKYTNFKGFGLGGAIIGFILMPFVITGLHQAPLMLEPGILAQSQEQLGHAFTWFNPIWFGAHTSMGFAVLAATIQIRKEYRKQIAAISIPASLSANFGITEPAIFGVALPLKYPMLGAAIGSAVGGYWAGMTQVQANSIGSASWIGIIQFDASPQYIYGNQVWNGQVPLFTPNFDAIEGQTRGWIEDGKFHVSYFEYNNIKSSLQSWAPMAHVSIILCLGAISGFISTFLLGRTKWGKKSIMSYYVDKGYEKKSKLKVLEKELKAGGTFINKIKNVFKK